MFSKKQPSRSVFTNLACPSAKLSRFVPAKALPNGQSIILAASVVAGCTLLGILASRFLDHENVIMIYLLGVTFIATRCGALISVVSCLFSVVCFGFFIVPPVFRLVPEDPHYVFTFAIMLVVAAIMSRIISAQREAQEMLSHQAELLNLTSDAIIAWTIDDGVVTFWNSGAEKMYGISMDAALGANVLQLLQGEYPEPFSSMVAKAKSNGSWKGEIRYKNLSGAVDVASRWTLKEDAPGNLGEIVEFATDITESKAAELRVKEFYSTVSHELRTPLTSIRGGLALLEHGLVEPGSDEALDVITIASGQSEKMSALINDMVDLQKIEAGKLELKLKPVVISSLIEAVVAELSQLAKASQITISTEIKYDPCLQIDEIRIGQVFTNLVANAIKFSPAESTVQIRSDCVAEQLMDGLINEAGQTLRVSIVDNGPGISPEGLPKLFNKFQQLDSSDTRSYGGSGLGLAISKALIEQHKGKIGVNSEVGKGSTFWFELKV
ncbi:hypothetical protein BH11CYA1_BH11CYA1_31890 [soil metagenome]